MIDSRFYGEANTFSAGDLAAALVEVCQTQMKEKCPPIEIEGGEATRPLSGVSSLKDAGSDHVAYYHNKSVLKNVDYEEVLKQTKAGAVFVNRENAHLVPQGTLCLIVLRPYRAFAAAINLFYPKLKKISDIHSTSIVHPTASLGEGTHIGPYVYIGQGVTIGKDCVIDSHVSLQYCTLGNNVHVKSGARIGQRGFGFEMDERGPIDMPQMGRVIIEDRVEIGANTCIDRGTLDDTIIGHGSRIDNLVQIAHSAKIGKNCILVAQVGIAGSTELGHYVMVGGQAGFAGHLKIGDGSRIAAQSGVMRDIPAKTDVAGSPCVGIREWHKQTIALKRMTSKK